MAKPINVFDARLLNDIRANTREVESGSSRFRRKPKPNRVSMWGTIALFLIAASLAVFGCQMKSDAQLQQDAYCKNVREGIWPDYEKAYKQECGGKDPPEFHEELAK